MPELDIGLVDGAELNIDQSFLHFNVKKKLYAKSSSRFHLNTWILNTRYYQLKQLSYCYSNANFIIIAFLSEKDNFFKM